ncbi:MAG: alpha/beta hydrolase domain-containing protein [Acidimicrobiia bacterium]
MSTGYDALSARQVSGPVTSGDGVVSPQPAAPLPDGYVEEEFFIGGTATRYTSDTPEDGFWAADPDGEADYETRVIVRRPERPDDFSGTVIVEWLNVTAIEASPDWGYAAQEIGREGHAYVAVSAQAQGVVGGDARLDVSVNEEAAADVGEDSALERDGLVNADPERYGTLTHPGDAYAYDIFSQVGRVLVDDSDVLLGGLEPDLVIASGQSQSAAFLTTYVNAVHPLVDVYDAFMIHSRGESVAPIDGAFASDLDDGDEAAVPVDGVLVRTDLDVPVFIFETESDLTLLGYATARQPDADLIHTWEVAGTAHTDAHVFRVFVGGPRDAGLGSLIECDDPINTGPHHETFQAALNHLVTWASGGPPPPEGARLEVDEDGDEATIVRDDNGIALGGVRNPLVDVPVVVTTGDPPEPADAGVCRLFGSTDELDQATLLDLYGSADVYLDEFAASAEKAVNDGFLLRPDADELLTEAEMNAALFG